MSLINYVEPINIGSVFIGFGGLLICCVGTYMLYKIYIKLIQYFDTIINREIKYEVLEEIFLDGIAKGKNIDLNKELIKRKVFQEKNKSFRKKIEDQIFKEMFGKDSE